MHGVSPIEWRFAELNDVCVSASSGNFNAVALFHCTNHKFVSNSVTIMPQMRYLSDCNRDTIVAGKVLGFWRDHRPTPGQTSHCSIAAVVRRQTTVAEADSCARCESFAGDCSLTLAFLRHWPARLRRPLQPRALLDSPARLLPDPRRSPSDSRTPPGSAEKS